MASWIVALLLAVAAFLVLALVAGSRLPLAHTSRVQARFRASPDKVWQTITNMVTAPNWRSRVRQIERLPDRGGNPVWVEVSRRWRMPLEFEAVEPGRKLVTRVLGEHLPFRGSWTYEIEPQDGGCTLTITEVVEINSQALRFFARYPSGYHANAARYLRDLGRKLGERVKPRRLS